MSGDQNRLLNKNSALYGGQGMQPHNYGEHSVMGCECAVCAGRSYQDANDYKNLIQYQSPNKSMPVCTGVLDYFPDAIREVSKVSLAGNKQHNIDGPLTWDRSKSADHADCLVRHQLLRGTRDTDGQLHSAKVAWRAMAQLQVELEQEKATS